MKKLLLIFFLFAVLSFSVTAQTQHDVDSALTVLKWQKGDSAKIIALLDVMYAYADFNNEEGLKYQKQTIELAEKLKWEAKIAEARKLIGRLYWRLGKFDEARENHFAALAIFEKEGDQFQIARTNTIIGQDYADEGKYPEAKKYFSIALKIFLSLKRKSDVANLYSLFSWVYTNEGDLAKSSEYNIKALKIFEEIKDEYSTATCKANMADEFTRQGNYTEALKIHKECLKPLRDARDNINLNSTYNNMSVDEMALGNFTQALNYLRSGLLAAEEIKNDFCIAESYNGIGDVYSVMQNYSKALSNYDSAAVHFKAVSNKQRLASVLNKIGIGYIYLGKFDVAKKQFDEELALAKQLESKTAFVDYFSGIEKLDSATGNWKNAFFNLKTFVLKRDSIYSAANTNLIFQQQIQYEFDKKEVADSLKFEKQKVFDEIKLQKQKTLTYGGLIGVAITLLLLFFVYRNFNKQRIANKKLEAAQEQILKSEKMAAIGEIASHLARQIQNPLESVNDFSNQSHQLAIEINASDDEGQKKKSTDMLKNNLQKINEQGKLASDFVRQLQEQTNKGNAKLFSE